MQPNDASTLRSAWEGWELLGIRPADQRHPPTIRLVLPVRLWDDDIALDHVRLKRAWEEFSGRMDSDAPRGVEADKRFPIWEPPEPDDALLHELAPAPRELCGSEGGMRIWRMTSRALQSPTFLGGSRESWLLECRDHKGEAAIPVKIASVCCWSAREGLAYIILDLELLERVNARGTEGSAATRVEDFLDALHHARFLHRGGATLVREQQIHPRSGRSSPPDMELLGQRSWKPIDQEGRFRFELPVGDLMDALFHRITGRSATERSRASLGNPNALHAYALLDVRSSHASTREDAARKRLVLQAAEMAPAKRDIRRTLVCDMPDAGVRAYEYSENAFFACSPECTVFLSIDQSDTPFWKNTMPRHVLDEYFAIQILTMYQRHIVDEVRRLAGAGDRLGPGSSPGDRDHDRWWEAVQERALRAKSDGFFIEVSMRTNHARFESILRQTLHVDRAYEMAMGLVDALCETQIARVEMRREQDSRRREQRWQTIAGFTILPTIGLTILNINMDGITVREDGMTWWAVLVLMALFALIGVLLVRVFSDGRR